MFVELRPLSLGEVLDRTFQIFRARFLMFTGIASVAALFELLWKLAEQQALAYLQGHHAAAAMRQVATGASSLLTIGAYIVAATLSFAATAHAVSDIYKGQEPGIARSYAAVRPHWFRYVLLQITAVLLMWSGVLLALIGIAVSIALARRAHTLSTAQMVTTMYGVMGFVIVVAVPFAVWMALRYSLANCTAVLEDLRIWGSLKRSVLLSKGSRGRIFVGLLMGVSVNFFLSMIATIPFLSLFVRSRGHVPLGATLYMLGAQFVISSLTFPIYGIALTLFYYDARVRKEGLDVEWLLARAGEPVRPAPVIGEPPPGYSLG